MNKNTKIQIKKMLEILRGLYYMRRRTLTREEKRIIRLIAQERVGKDSHDPSALSKINPEEFTARNLKSLYGILAAHGYNFNNNDWSSASTVFVIIPKFGKNNGFGEEKNPITTLDRARQWRGSVLRQRFPYNGK